MHFSTSPSGLRPFSCLFAMILATAASQAADLDVTGNLTVEGTISNPTGPVAVTGGLTLGGTLTLDGALLNSTGTVTIEGALDLEGDVLGFGLQSGSGDVGSHLQFTDVVPTSGTSYSILDSHIRRQAGKWLWTLDAVLSGSNTMMELDVNGGLQLPNTPSLSGSAATDYSVVTRAQGDARYMLRQSMFTNGNAVTIGSSSGQALGVFHPDHIGTDAVSVGIGNYVKNPTMSGVSVGKYCWNAGDDSTTIGRSAGCGSGAAGSTAIGYSVWALGYYATAIGTQTMAEGSESVAIGYFSRSRGSKSLALGWFQPPPSSGDPMLLPGANGEFSTALTGGTASGGDSMAVGRSAQAFGSNSVAIGSVTAKSQNEFVIGSYNVLNPTVGSTLAGDGVFVVGNGTSTSARSNAFVVRRNGDADVSGKLKVAGDTEITGSVKAGSFNGPMLVAPSGDIGMGIYTEGPTPAP